MSISPACKAWSWSFDVISYNVIDTFGRSLRNAEMIFGKKDSKEELVLRRF